VRRFVTRPRGEFVLQTANQYFGGWVDPTPGDELVVPITFPVEGWSASASVLVRQDASGAVIGDVHGAGRQAEAAWNQAVAVLSLDVDGSGYAAVGKRDPVIAARLKMHSGLRPVLFHSPYEAAAAFTIGHRISIAQGRAIRKRMSAELGEAISTPAGVQHAFPSPQALLELRSYPGITKAKIPRLHAVAHAALDGLLDRARLRGVDEAQALAELRGLPGIGLFFAQGILMRGAGLVDAVSDDDISKAAIKSLYRLRTLPTQSKVLAIAEAWRPFRMWVIVLLHVGYRREGGYGRKPVTD
jgi:DNA-3-methyladenine glycosylase II